ncbi:MAG TPA: hypothetical protein VF544_01575 [Pyrinomonadaceae bacterium]|jgi:ElaB/YqjD/DUF883 family membrane-anchored ribosome-binding protein
MAEERDLATVRATETTDTQEVSKEELQRRMEEARESITQTVAEIKDTVTNQYQAVKESVTEALDWREQYRKRPVAFSIGALSVGFIVGYALAGAFVSEDEQDYRSYEQDEAQGTRATAAIAPAAHYYRNEGVEGSQPSASHSYAAQAITGSSAFGASGSGSATGSFHEAALSASSPAPYQATQPSAGLETTAAEEEEPKGPGLIERFKGTKAYDRLEEEVSALGDRFLDELSKTAQTVVLPLLFNKVKDLFGVDLSNKAGGRSSSAGGSTETNAALSGAAQSSFAGVSRGAGSGGQDESTAGGPGTSGTGNQATGGTGSAESAGGSSYATSENRGYGASAGGGVSDYNRGSD